MATSLSRAFRASNIRGEWMGKVPTFWSLRPVVHEEGAGQVVGIEERGHAQVYLRGVPEKPALALESQRRQGPVVVSVAGDSRLEEGRVNHGVGGGEGAIAVAADSDPAPVHPTSGSRMVSMTALRLFLRSWT